MCVCARMLARFGSVPHCLRLTGCPCRVNKTNLRSGLARRGGECLQEWCAHQGRRRHTHMHTHTTHTNLEMFALSSSHIHIHGPHLIGGQTLQFPWEDTNKHYIFLWERTVNTHSYSAREQINIKPESQQRCKDPFLSFSHTHTQTAFHNYSPCFSSTGILIKSINFLFLLSHIFCCIFNSRIHYSINCTFSTTPSSLTLLIRQVVESMCIYQFTVMKHITGVLLLYLSISILFCFLCLLTTV